MMPGARNMVARVVASIARAIEGQYRPGPYVLPVTGGFLSADAGQYWNFWQLGYDPIGLGARSAIVEACVSAYAQTIAMCPGSHWEGTPKGGRERVTTSALSRILRHPNDYESISDFMLNLTRSLYLEGNAYALALRNDRFEINELHLMRPDMSMPQLAVTGDVFYHLDGNDVIRRRLETQSFQKLIVPQRDVLHIRLHADRRYPYPLRGESPLTSALMDIAASSAILGQQTQFYLNQARPSAVLQTDMTLDHDQVQQLRDRWDEQAKGLCGGGPGGVPILTHGIKVTPWTTPPKDAAIAEVMKFTEQHIALAYRVPLPVLGLGGQTYGSTEALMQSWIASGLGFALAHIEEGFGVLFDLYGQPDEYVEFDTAALLRSAFKDRIEGLARAVQGGIFSPNEARGQEDLKSVPHGDEPRVQQQVVPLSASAGITDGGGSGPHPPPAPAPEAAPPAAAQPAPKLPKRLSPDDQQREVRRLFERSARIQRRL
jgi:HK97 family phage portal protein